MITKVSLCFIFILMVSDCKPQKHMPFAGVVSDMDLVLDCLQKNFSKKKVAEVYIVEKPDPEWLLLATPFDHPDTAFFGLHPNGRIKYSLSLIIESWPIPDSNFDIGDNGWRGYDTFQINKRCDLKYFCRYIGSYDSIAFNKKGQVSFIKWRYMIVEVKNIFDEKDRLAEQHVRHLAPQGWYNYKAFYKYDFSNRLTEIGYGYGTPGKKTTYPLKDIFNDYEYLTTYKKIITYNKHQQIKAINYYELNKETNIFNLFGKTQYKYEDGLLKQVASFEPATNEITYMENVGYKFY